ncbi:sensor histidine kinase [Paenibacillaceae bacterium]|nr:sensor histidine kinase [Paenibacillaceae bacterium]
MSIRLRLTLWYSGLLAVTLLAFGITLYLVVSYNTYNGVKSQIYRQVESLQITPVKDLFERLELIVRPNSIQSQELYIQVINYTTKPHIVSKTTNLSGVQLAFPDSASEIEDGFVKTTMEGYSFLVYQKQLKLAATGERIGLLQVAAITERERLIMDTLRTFLIFSSIAVVLIGFTIGLFLARKALRPIDNVIEATNRIKNGSNLSVRIQREEPNDEMGRLTDTLNSMLARLETTYNELDEAYKTQRRFVSDASHELRTPLTTIRGNIDLLEKMWQPELKKLAASEQTRGEGSDPAGSALISFDREIAIMSMEAMRDVSDEAKRMSRLVSDLLSLARADAGYVMERTPTQLLQIMEDVARNAQLLPRTVELRVADLSALNGVMVNGNKDYLRQLIFIFIENAFKYTTSGYVELQAQIVSGQAGIVIQDTGIGMNMEEVPHIFERFYRADVSRGKTAGTGLGLSIAKWIIDEHGGSIEVKTREGEGSTFIVWLPVVFPPSADSDIIEERDWK